MSWNTINIKYVCLFRIVKMFSRVNFFKTKKNVEFIFDLINMRARKKKVDSIIGRFSIIYIDMISYYWICLQSSFDFLLVFFLLLSSVDVLGKQWDKKERNSNRRRKKKRSRFFIVRHILSLIIDLPLSSSLLSSGCFRYTNTPFSVLVVVVVIFLVRYLDCRSCPDIILFLN